MATLEQAVAARVLEVYDLPDWEQRLPLRPLWVACELWDWIDGTDQLHDMAFAVGRRTLFEHLEQMFCDFRCSPRFPAGDLKQMIPNQKGIRKMHPPKLRVYGWAPAKQAFVAVCAALEMDTKTNKTLSDKKRDEVLRFIKKYKLEHTIVKGDNSAVYPPLT